MIDLRQNGHLTIGDLNLCSHWHACGSVSSGCHHHVLIELLSTFPSLTSTALATRTIPMHLIEMTRTRVFSSNQWQSQNLDNGRNRDYGMESMSLPAAEGLFEHQAYRLRRIHRYIHVLMIACALKSLDRQQSRGPHNRDSHACSHESQS